MDISFKDDVTAILLLGVSLMITIEQAVLFHKREREGREKITTTTVYDFFLIWRPPLYTGCRKSRDTVPFKAARYIYTHSSYF